MKKNSVKPISKLKPYLLVTITLLAMLFLCSCGSDNNTTPLPSGPVIKKAYYIGNVNEGLAPYLIKRSISFKPYDGKATDGVLFVSYRQGFTPQGVDKQWMQTAYNAGNFVVLVHAGVDQVNEFLEDLGLEPNFDLPTDSQELKKVELFAINKRQREDSGFDKFIWVTPVTDLATLSPLPAKTSVNSDMIFEQPVEDYDLDPIMFNDMRAQNFIKYIADENSRLEALQTSKKSAVTTASTTNADLAQISEARIYTYDVSVPSQTFQLTYYLYACHSYNAADNIDYDWFIVQQRGMLNPSLLYSNKDGWMKNIITPVLSEIKGYMVEYRFDNRIETSISNNFIQLMNSSPATTNGSASVTSGFSWNLGGNIGFTGTSPTLNISAGISYSTSESVVVEDCKVNNTSAPADDKVKAAWSYSFPRPTIKPNSAPFYLGDFNDAVLLSRSNFQPYNQWMWKIAPEARDDAKGFVSDFTWKNGISTGNVHEVWIETYQTEHNIWQTNTNSFFIPFSYPPLIAGNNLHFEAKGSAKVFEFASARAWTATSSESWCTLDKTSGSGNDTGNVYVTVDPNSTGADRKAIITLKTTDEKGYFEVEVVQSRY